MRAGPCGQLSKSPLAIVCTCLPTMRVTLKSDFGRNIAQALGFSSLTPNHQSSTKRPWIRASQYNEVYGPWRVRNNAESNHHSDVTTGASQEDGSNPAREIRVLEEVKVELQQIKPAQTPAP
ncbi:hypothetical protein BDV29DRAFT_156755 [Aspergillus leporis]|uniref:Uncharacterized protein n=1 Tax=Aspergillus leporis TaxID=41062 RepID=A0A5N5X2R0_9EURO|nr:hypothetical protein BDV29DRAFT_156755 [Aspergillus leporis]